ncbi:MAG: cytochrome ubiquinol oxidase subunit I [Candidatus Tectomicrobia bacterium]|nr:cytochrome ubiquinol oxidase subunit I [Candidatus Tectomicrobia bacterium]
MRWRLFRTRLRFAARLWPRRLPGWLLAAAALASLVVAEAAFAEAPKQMVYREFPLIGSRVAVWVVAQLHLMFAAFVLGVPMFAVIVEIIGSASKDPAQGQRLDNLSREFTKLLLVAFSATAILGALLLFLFIGLYPTFFTYLTSIFFPTMAAYAVLFFGESFTLYLYWYGWDSLKHRKGVHIGLGVLLNLFGISLMFISDSWLTFMSSPNGIDDAGNLVSLWGAVNNFTWMPINIHRFIANIAFGGSIVAAYAAFRFLVSSTEEERAHYDWMGYIGNFIAISGFIPLPFAGYWLGREIYSFSQQMGLTMMGGVFSWLFIVQAVLIGALFLGANYYLWLAMGRIEGGERYQKYTKYLLLILTACFLIWMTPHSLVASLEEARKMGGAHHPLLGVLGVMSAKNTVVNIMILTTFLSFTLYRRANKVSVHPRRRLLKTIQALVFLAAAFIVIFYGIYGYYVEAIVRIGFSVYQVSAVLITFIVVIALDVPLFRKARATGVIRWGKVPVRSQYTLFLVATSFTWLMGLMGYARSGLRLHWHIWGVLRDTSAHAFTPTLGYATLVISIIVAIFLGFIGFIFWVGHLGEEKKHPTPEAAGMLPAAMEPATV